MPPLRARSFAGWLLLPVLLVVGCSSNAPPDDAAETGRDVSAEQQPVAPAADPATALHDAAAAVVAAGSVVATIDVEIHDDVAGSMKMQLIEEVIVDGDSAVGVFVAGSEPLLRMVFHGDTVYVTNDLVEREVAFGFWLEEDRTTVAELVTDVALADLPQLPPVLEVAFEGELVRQLLDASQDTAEVTVLGRDLAQGKPATRYLARLELPAFDDETVQAEVWVGDDGYLLRLELLVAASAQTTVSLDVLLSDHGTLPASLVPDPDFVTSVQALEDEERAMEAEAEQRVETLEADGFSQAEIAALAGDRLSMIATSLFWHPDGRQLCVAELWEGFDAEIEGYADGEWTLDCVVPEIDLDRYCAGAALTREGMPYEPYDWKVVADGLEEMSLGWNDGPFTEDYDDPLHTEAWMLHSAAETARDRAAGSLGDPDLQSWLAAGLRDHLHTADRLCS